MGNSSSADYADGDDYDKFDGIETLGYRVLGVQPHSPASSAGLVSFFDFIVGANGERLLGSGEGLQDGDEYDDVDFPALLKSYIGKELELLVWNIKSQSQRWITLTPSDRWGGTGLLGVTIRLDNYGGADERLVRVLRVEHNSPAAIAGLTPLKDYVLGTTMCSLESADDLLRFVLQPHVDRVVELYVYNTESDVVRVVALMPTLSWGGRGLLGAEVGTGYLHSLPSSCRSTTGSSMERKVRMGVRPSDYAPPAAASGRSGGGVGGNAQMRGGSTAGAIAPVEFISSTNGTALHMDPQLELEEPSEQEKEEEQQVVMVKEEQQQQHAPSAERQLETPAVNGTKMQPVAAEPSVKPTSTSALPQQQHQQQPPKQQHFVKEAPRVQHNSNGSSSRHANDNAPAAALVAPTNPVSLQPAVAPSAVTAASNRTGTDATKDVVVPSSLAQSMDAASLFDGPPPESSALSDGLVGNKKSQPTAAAPQQSKTWFLPPPPLSNFSKN